jgi:hypothetical protein
MHRSAEEVEQEHLNVLGPRLGPLYHALENEVTWLHAKWNQFRHLYASEENVELLNEAAGFFFAVLQDVLWHDTLLHLARLTDPSRSHGSKDNLSLRRLPEVIEDPTLSARVETLVADAVTSCEFARDWRNRHLAHRDLTLALNSGAVPLPGISRADIERSLAAFRAVLNEIKRHYWNETVVFEDFRAIGDAGCLTRRLARSVKAERNQRERWSRGIILPEDLAS